MKQKWACKDGAEMEHTSYTQMEQKLITKWSRHGRQKGTDMEYTMEQKCIAEWNRHENTKWNRNGIHNATAMEYTMEQK